MASTSNTKKMASSKHLDWDLLKDLMCDVCGEYMVSIIETCEKGHDVCYRCWSRLSNCRLCQNKSNVVMNFTLKRIAARTIFPCKYRLAGCEETLTVNDIKNHRSECLFESRQCPFKEFSDVKCPWSGILSDIGGHVRSEHRTEVSEHTSGFEVILQNFSTEKRYFKAIFIWGKLFYLVWQTTQLTFYFSVFHVGHKNEADEFIYEFKLGKYRETIAINGICRSYLQAKSKTPRLDECVTLHYNTVQKYLSQSEDLSCEIEIRKKSLVEVAILERWRIFAAPSENPNPSETA